MPNMPRFDLNRFAGPAQSAGLQLGRYVRLMRLDRPIGIWLLLWPTLWALWIAGAGRPAPAVFAVFVAGTVVLRSAGCVINDFIDRRIDPHVSRTADRPIASGAVLPGEALILFVGLMLIGLGLVMTMNALTLALAVLGAVLTVIYPFMKRIIAAPQLVLGLAFAWGVPMAFAAQTGALAAEGSVWLLYLCAIIWVVIYDTQYAMSDRADDLKLGIQSTAILFGEMDVVIVAGLQAVLLAGLLLVGQREELGLWFWLGLVAAAACALRQLWLIRERAPADCLRAFWNNAWLGGAVFAGIALDYLFRVP
jgi:4-hydroxybenzoate polyprenyltransferase